MHYYVFFFFFRTAVWKCSQCGSSVYPIHLSACPLLDLWPDIRYGVSPLQSNQLLLGNVVFTQMFVLFQDFDDLLDSLHDDTSDCF